MEINEKRFNRGTRYGRDMIRHSLRELGCGRSVLCDKDGVILCGNEVYRTALELGKKIVTIETDGDVLVCVKRTDVSFSDKKGKELSLVDNLSCEKNLDWDADVVLSAMDDDLSFDPRNWGGHGCMIKDLDLGQLFKDGSPLKETRTDGDESFDFQQLCLFDDLGE